MKNLRRLAFKTLPLILIIFFAACSGDDSSEPVAPDYSSDKLVGKWKLVGFETFDSGDYIPIDDNMTVYEFSGNGGGKYYLSATSSFDLTWQNLGNSVYHASHYGGDWTLPVEFQDNDNTIRIEDSDSASYYERK